MSSAIASLSAPDKKFFRKWYDDAYNGGARVLVAIAALATLLSTAGPYLINISDDTDTISDYQKQIVSNLTFIQTASLSVAKIDAQLDDWRPWIEDIKSKTDTIQKSTSSMKIALDAVAADTTEIATAGTASAALLKLMHQQNTNYLKRYTEQEAREGKMVASLAAIEATLDKILIEVTKMAATTFLQKLNTAVSRIRSTNSDWAQIDLDACESFLGEGPINCEGMELEVGTLVGVTFH